MAHQSFFFEVSRSKGKRTDAGTGLCLNGTARAIYSYTELPHHNGNEPDEQYLGEIQFNGIGYFEWRYLGDRLFDKEVWQIVDLLQNSVRIYI